MGHVGHEIGIVLNQQNSHLQKHLVLSPGYQRPPWTTIKPSSVDEVLTYVDPALTPAALGVLRNPSFQDGQCSGIIMNKLPQITLAFWVMKICATTLGETAGDLMSMTLNVGYAMSSLILISPFLISLIGQLRARIYHPALYWTVILTTSTAGTTMSDFLLDRTLGLGYATGSAILIAILVTTMVVWKLSEGSLAVDMTIRSRRGELFIGRPSFSPTPSVLHLVTT